MSSMEKKKMIDERINILEDKMKERYETVFEINDQKCFKVREDEFFMLTRLSWANAIVIEHAFSVDEAKKNMFEDGDLFYMDEMNESEMYNAMIREIEDC